MDSGNTQMYVEDRIEAPGARPSPGLRTASDRAGDEPTTSEVCQAVFPDAEAMDSGPQPAPALGALETGPGHRDASEEGFPQLSPQEQKPPAGPGTKLSSWVPQEGRRELQAHQDLATPGSELGVPPNGVPVTQEGLQQQGSGKETEDQQGSQRNPEPVEGQGPESRQDPEGEPIPGRLAASESDTVQPTEPYCTLDSCEQQLEDKPPKEVDTPPIGPQRALPEPSPGGCEDSSQEEVSLMPTATLEEKTVHTAPPPRPRSDTPKARDEAVEIQPTLGPARPPEAVDTGARGLDPTQKKPQEPAAATGARDPGSARPGFMRRLLEVEEEEAALRREPPQKASGSERGPMALTSPPDSRPGVAPICPSSVAPASPGSLSLTLKPLLIANPASLSNPSRRLSPLPCSLGSLKDSCDLSKPPQGPSYDPPALAAPSHPQLSGSGAGVGSRMCPGPGSVLCRQELEERCLLNVCQTWEERAEEHLTMKQEEAFRSYFEIFNGHGEVDAQSLENILLLVGISLTTAQVEGALRSADIDGDGHVNFKDFLTVMTDTRRFFCSVEQNALMDMAPPNPDTLFFEILSLLVEMLALPEGALEEITSYYQRKLKEGACKARETESATGRLRPRKKLPYSPPQADTLEIPERRVLRVLSRLKQQNYAANLQSPYAQVPCIPLCPRLDKKTVRRKQGGHYELEQCPSTGLGPDIHSILLHTGSQGGRWVPRGHGRPRRRPICRCVRGPGPNPRGIQRSRRWMQTLLFQGREGKGQKREETSL
ncbi:PREDICTED: spermatogenesis-associated protein 21 [Bison bison bison]|uniref:Spermatogenesis-associated protein 21 n=1 Tax=Bison bison bison TaxID=43346 RepID=A0A6P3J894_BISBB|nr:PREDICTED: spermatogenesis-associated protein 21 [Bison bison bison]